MDFIIEILLGIVTLTLCLVYYKFCRRPKNVPPGPLRLPLLGNLHQLSLEPAKDFMQWREKYGDIISVDFGPYPAVVINDYKLIKEALNEMVFAGRPKFEALKQRSLGKWSGIIFADGKDWVEQRRFVLKNLRDFGFGKKSMESLVQEEINELITTFKKDVGKPITTQNCFNAAVLNALWSIITGQRYSHDDPVLSDLIKRLTSGVQQSRSVSVGLFFPFLKKILPHWVFGGVSTQERNENHQVTIKFMKDSIKYHQNTYQETNSRDFIDVYLKEINRTVDQESSFYGKDGERNLTIVMLDLFVAGAETTSTTLAWMFLLLALYPKEQEKLYQEIKNVVGTSRLPSLTDRPNMPFTEAVIMETMRYSAMVPLSVQHRTIENFEFKGYFIPKDTLIIPNLYCAHKDPNIWGDPGTFRPARFLSEDGTKVIRHEALIPFSTGKRVCLGESLARDELFLFTTSLFQRFQVNKDPENSFENIEYYTAAVLLPKPHPVILRDRFEEE